MLIGLDQPILSHSEEASALHDLAAGGLDVITITGGPGVADVAAELMDPRARKRAAKVGHDDGAAAAHLIRGLVDD